MTTKTHEIKLDGYGAHTTLAEDRPIMLLGTAESYGIEKLHVVSGKSWEGLTVTATFNAPDGTSTDMLMSADGSITVPSEATAKSGSGKIVFTGVSNGIQRISCDLEYFVVAHSAINGVQSGGTAPSWFEQAATRFMPPGGTAGQVLTKKTDADFAAEWQDSQGGAGGGGTTDHSKLENRDAADQHPISAITGLEDELANKQPSGEYLTQEDLQAATDTALAQAKASGEFDGADGLTPTIGENGNWYLGNTDTGKPSRGDKGDKGDKGDTGETGATGAAGAAGKSAYEYAQDGGYTGTEAEFAAKLAQEKFANPNALTFTGAVTGSYDGSELLTVEIPSGGEEWETILNLTLEEDVNKVVLMSGDVGYKKIMVYMESVPPTDQTATSNQAISIYSGEADMFNATAKLNGAYLYNGNRLSGVSIELTPYAANAFASGAGGWYDSGSSTEVKMGYSSKNSLSKPIKELTVQVWSNAQLGVGSWFKVYGVRV